MSKINKLLVEKYRPSNVDQYVFNNDVTKKLVSKWINSGEIPNILLAGTPGVGKSALAKVIINELNIEPSDVKTINASLLKTADIENELIPWMKKASFGKMKIVFLDEADRIDPNHGQKILRHVIEEYSDHVRFIATCNYKNKITPPLHSRFQMIELDSMDEDGVVNLVADILEQEELTFESEDAIFSHIDTYAPDIRKILNSIDEHTGEDKIVHPLTTSANSQDIDAWSALWNEKKFDINVALELTESIDQSNFEEFYEVMYMNASHFPDQSRGIILLSQYLDRAMHSANQRLHLHAFLLHTFMTEDD